MEYIERLIRIAERAVELVEDSYCWVTEDKKGCGKCLWCLLAEEVDALREDPDQ